MASRFHYFAYGSNMLTQRLAARCPGIVPVGAAALQGYTLNFSKVGRDLSGKATPVAQAGAALHGVLFHIDAADLAVLDRIEGVGAGYERVNVALHQDGAAETIEAVTYVATHTDERLRPFLWYRALVLAGAMQHALPEAHQALIRGFDCDDDLHEARKGRVEALGVLDAAGFGHLV